MAQDRSDSFLWFLAGAAAGVAAGILFAPASGQVTRRKLARKAGEGRTALAESGKDLMERGRELYDQGRKIADEAAEMLERGRKLVEG